MAPARSWSLRVATPQDVDTVSALLDRAYADAWASHYEPVIVVAARPHIIRANPVLLASSTYYLALSDDGVAIGCGGWTHEAPGTAIVTAGVGHIRHFATDPDWSRQGIGASMLTRCIAEARLAGLATLRADAALGFEGFYAAYGFEREGASAPVIGGVAMPVTMMRLALR